MKGQLNLFEPEFIKDIDCTIDTPVTRGKKDKPIYGTGKHIKPRVPGRTETQHMKDIYLEELLPLEEYDLIVVLYGCRMKFPAKSGNLMTRWCSPYLKIDVAATVLRNLETVKENSKVLICSGERRGESKGRSKYNEMEIYFRANAEKKLKRTVHQWRPVIDYSEKDVWEVLKRNRVNPHPCYRAGWNRCSCAGCIFSTPELFAGFKELYPAEFEEMKHDEKALGFTLDNKCDLETYIEGAKPCLYKGDKEAIHSLITGIFTESDIFIDGVWKYPAGAFHGAEGGPC